MVTTVVAHHGISIGHQLHVVFHDVYAHYGLCYPSPRGNVRGFITTTPRGTRYNGKIAPFLREIREEVIVDWTQFTPDAVLAIICKFLILFFF